MGFIGIKTEEVNEFIIDLFYNYMKNFMLKHSLIIIENQIQQSLLNSQYPFAF